MINHSPDVTRTLHHVHSDVDLCVIGGGMSGIAAAVTAAREGLSVALVHDRPVLGGNASKEIRVWLHGSEGGHNNAYFRETGLMEELRLDNLRHNPTGNVEAWNLLLLNLVLAEKNIQLFLNTNVFQVRKDKPHRVHSVTGLTSGSERVVTIHAKQFVDSTGDGTVAYLAGAEYMVGREAKHTFGETLAPETADPYTLSGTILFQVKNEDQDVPFVKPSWAHTITEEQLTLRKHPIKAQGVHYWWIEYGGIRDTIRENEAVRDELLRLVYGIWDHLKNHPNHREENRHLSLEWVGSLVGKRESRRFIGDHILTERDILEQTDFPDAVCYGGWDIDRHPPQGFFAQDEYPSDRYQIPGTYNIPLRSLYAKGFDNLYLAGRDASFSHVALCSTRVMVTCAQMGAAVGVAAAYAQEHGITPQQAAMDPHIGRIQQRLLRRDHDWRGAKNLDPMDHARSASVTASSVGSLCLLPEASLSSLSAAEVETARLDDDIASAKDMVVRQEMVSTKEIALTKDLALMLPLTKGPVKYIDLFPSDLGQQPQGGLSIPSPIRLRVALHAPDPKGNFIPGTLLKSLDQELTPFVDDHGQLRVRLPLDVDIHDEGFHYLVIHRPDLRSYERDGANKTDGENKTDDPIRLRVTTRKKVGIRTYEESPQQWANGRNLYSRWKKVDYNLCFDIDPRPEVYGAENVINGFARPFRMPNLWSSTQTDFSRPESLTLRWPTPVTISEVHLKFNTDLDHDLRNLFVVYPFRAMKDCVKDYEIRVRALDEPDGAVWHTIVQVTDNHQRLRKHTFQPVTVDALEIVIRGTHGLNRAEVYEVRVY